MFPKRLETRTDVVMRGKEVKQFRSQLAAVMGVSEEELAPVLPPKVRREGERRGASRVDGKGGCAGESWGALAPHASIFPFSIKHCVPLHEARGLGGRDGHGKWDRGSICLAPRQWGVCVLQWAFS